MNKNSSEQAIQILYQLVTADKSLIKVCVLLKVGAKTRHKKARYPPFAFEALRSPCHEKVGPRINASHPLRRLVALKILRFQKRDLKSELLTISCIEESQKYILNAKVVNNSHFVKFDNFIFDGFRTLSR